MKSLTTFTTVSKNGARTKEPVTLTMADCVRIYREKNNRGAGYAPYVDTAGDDSIDSAIEAAATDGWQLAIDRNTSDEVAALVNPDGDVMAIGGDSRGRNAWAVVIHEGGA